MCVRLGNRERVTERKQGGRRSYTIAHISFSAPCWANFYYRCVTQLPAVPAHVKKTKQWGERTFGLGAADTIGEAASDFNIVHFDGIGIQKLCHNYFLLW